MTVSEMEDFWMVPPDVALTVKLVVPAGVAGRLIFWLAIYA